MRDARLQRRVFALCWVGYTVSYLLRANLSAVLDQLIAELHITRAMAGTIGSLYFWMYAVGQFVNGFLAERLNPKRMVAAGLALSIALNCAVGFARSYPLILILWALNGYALSMIWTPTFKILTNWHSPEEYRKLSVWISLPTSVGYLISWSLIRTIASNLSWRFAFFLPAACGALMLAAWAVFLKPTPPAESAAATASDGADGVDGVAMEWEPHRSMLRLLLVFGLIFVGVVAMIQGLIKESVNLWGPTLMSELASGLGGDLSMWFSIGIPVAGTLGILSVDRLLRYCGNSGAKALIALFSLAGACAAAVFLFRPTLLVSALLLSIMMAGVCGANVVITVFLPIGFVRHGISAQVSGMLNFLVYLGAGLGGSLSGFASDRWGWSSMYLLWAMLSLLGCGAVALWQLWLRRKRHASTQSAAQ